MLRDRKIALFIDVDNLGLNTEHYENVLKQLEPMGEIVFGAVYGAGERKHRKIIEHAELNGFVVRRVARTKRRGRKNFDNRIVVDAVDAVLSNRAIDTVCVLAQPTDMVYLYGYLRNKGMAIIAADNNNDEASRNFVNEFIDLGVIEVVKLPAKKKAAKPVVTAAPVEEQVAAEETATTNSTLAEEVDQTDALLRQIEQLRANTEQMAPAQNAEPAQAATTSTDEASATTETATTATPRGQYVAQEGLADQINDARNAGNNDADQADLLEQIKKLLDGVE